MKKFSIYSLIILNSFVIFTQAMENESQSDKIVREMREQVQVVSYAYNRAINIEGSAKRLQALKNLAMHAEDVANFLKNNQQYGMGGIKRIRDLRRQIHEGIMLVNSVAMDTDVAVSNEY